MKVPKRHASVAAAMSLLLLAMASPANVLANAEATAEAKSDGKTMEKADAKAQSRQSTGNTTSSSEGRVMTKPGHGSTVSVNISRDGNSTRTTGSGRPGAQSPRPPRPAKPPIQGPIESAEEGAVRLVSRVDVNGYATGALQAFIGGQWGAVCNSGLDDRDAQVACRQLGFVGGMVLGPTDTLLTPFEPDPETLAPFVLENLGCAGNEAAILDCPLHDQSEIDYVTLGYRYGDYTYVNPGKCDPVSDSYTFLACGLGSGAGVLQLVYLSALIWSFYNPTEGSVRLAGGAKSPDGSAEYGRVEISHRGGWGTVCGRLSGRTGAFVPPSADVVCKELGYTEGSRMQTLVDEELAPVERVPIVLAGAACTGNETALAQCPGVGLDADNNNCEHARDVWVSCSSGAQPDVDGRLRLAGGSSGPGYQYGRLEVFLRGFWSNVCGRFTPDSAQVACSGLGYDGGSTLWFIQPYATRFFVPGGSRNQVLVSDIPVALAAVDCDGNETSLLECQNNPEFVRNCASESSSTVLACANTAAGCDKEANATEGALRLRGGTGTLCDPLHSGFVEIYHNGEWGAICISVFQLDLLRPQDKLAADVACRQLGFPHGTLVDPLVPLAPPEEPLDNESPRRDYDYLDEEPEEPAGRFWLSDVQCVGPEGRLVDCDLGRGFRPENRACMDGRDRRMHVACRQFPVTEALEAVSTPGAEEGDLRLVDQTEVANWVTGRLEVFFEGSWGQVCQSAFEAADAAVACRQLGLGAGTVVPPNLDRAGRDALLDTEVFPEVVISFSGCSGDEDRLLDCPVEGGFNRDYDRVCRDSNSAGLRLACVSNPSKGAEGRVRLSGEAPGSAPGSAVGTLEVFHAGAWGTVCSGRPDSQRSYYDDPPVVDASAEVACRELGFGTGAFVQIGESPAAAAAPPPWLASVLCAGAEDAVADCELGTFGETTGCGPLLSVACTSTKAGNGRTRLVGGRADPRGGWGYGILQVLVSGAWSIIEDSPLVQGVQFGRRGAQVACRSLGYATGAQILAGRSSPLRTRDTDVVAVKSVSCDGSEDTLADCGLEYTNAYLSDYGYDYSDRESGNINEGTNSVALVCVTPSGCSVGVPGSGPESPEEGDIRLVPINGTAAATAPCDDVHFGGLEIFHAGQWGRICAGNYFPLARAEPEEFALDAQVACRELGFPFGTVMDTSEVDDAYDGQFAGSRFGFEPEVAWATQVVCKGTEERLRDCAFPENFEEPKPATGVLTTCGIDNSRRLGIVCRRFRIPESDVIRR